jgi:sugar lactone lactonase YvrE
MPHDPMDAARTHGDHAFLHVHSCTHFVRACRFREPAVARTLLAMQPPRILLLSLAMAAACSADDEPTGPRGERIELPGDMFYPEGVAFDADGNMFVSSILTGAVARVENDRSTATTFVAPGAVAGSAVGLAMSRSNDVLWMCLGTFGTEAAPAVIGIDAATGEERVRHHFPPQQDGRTGGLCNEITEDDDGNVYASDSFGARIVRISAGDRLAADRAQLWAAGPELAAQGFGVNGIAFHVDAILAVNTTSGALLKIPTATAAIETVAIERPLAGPDGLRVAGDRAIVVEQFAGSVRDRPSLRCDLHPVGGGLSTPPRSM